MEKKYWIGRKRASMKMARAAASAEARLIHYDLAGRYSVKAAQCAPFMLPREAPATEGEQAALRLPLPARPRPGSIYRKRIDPRDWGTPEKPEGDRP